MAEYTVRETEMVRDIPGNPQEKGGPAKVVRLILEGDDRTPELFATARTEIPSVVRDDEMEFSDQWNRWQMKKKPSAGGGGGGFKRSPADTRAIQRQHSQEMALRREANLIAAGFRPLDDATMEALVDWFEVNIKGTGTDKNHSVVTGLLTSDVPADTSDLPWGEEVS